MTLLGLMEHYATFRSGRLTRQEQGDAAAHGGFHPLAGTLVAKEAGSCWIPGSYTPCKGLKYLISKGFFKDATSVAPPGESL